MRPTITHDPAVNFGRPMIGPAPVEAVCGRIWAGEPLTEVAEDHNLSREQALVACWYQAAYGARSWRKHWLVWAQDSNRAIRTGDYDTIPDPPARAAK